jgi:hypothetical protein
VCNYTMIDVKVNSPTFKNCKYHPINSPKKVEVLIEHGYDPEKWTCSQSRTTKRWLFKTIKEFYEVRRTFADRALIRKKEKEEAERRSRLKKERPINDLREREERKSPTARWRTNWNDLERQIYIRKTDRPYSTPEWKLLGHEQRMLRDYRLLNEVLAKHGRVVYDALCEARWILVRNPMGFLKTEYINANSHFRRCFALPHGHLVMAGILKLVDRTYILGVQSQRYVLGEFAPVIEWWAIRNGIEDHISPKDIEDFNERTVASAKKKNAEIVQQSIWTMYRIGYRLYNPLVYAPKEEKLRLYRRLGFNINEIVTLDINCAMHAMVNNLACSYSPSLRDELTTVEQLKIYREELASTFHIPIKLAKSILSAVGNLSKNLLYSKVWDDFPEVAYGTKAEICKHDIILRLQDEAWKRYYHLHKNKAFRRHGITKRNLTASQMMANLYFKLESEIMAKCFAYLDQAGIKYLPMHDGCDLLSKITDEQREELCRLLADSGLTISFKNLVEQRTPKPNCENERFEKKYTYPMYHHDLQHYGVSYSEWLTSESFQDDLKLVNTLFPDDFP